MANANLKVVITAVDKASKTMKGIGGNFQGLSGAAAAAGGAAAVAFGTQSVQAFADAEKSQAKLVEAYKKFPQLAGGNIDTLRDLNKELANKTRFDDDAYAAAQAQLAQYGLTEGQLANLSPLVADYAARTGTDLETAAQQVGKAMLGQGRALKNVGINFEDAGSVGANFEQVMAGLSDKVGGFASADAETAAGKTEILKNKFGEIQESVGGALVPALQRLADVMIPLFQFISDNMSWILPLAGIFLAIATAVWAINAATGAWTAVQAVFNAVMAANPIVLVVLAIGALVAAFVVAYNKSETFRNIVDGALRGVARAFGWLKDKAAAAFKWIKEKGFDFIVTVIKNSPLGLTIRGVYAAFKWFRDKVSGAIKWVGDKWDGFVSFIKGLPDALGDFGTTVLNVLTWPFRTAFNAIADLWNNTVGRLSFSVPDWVPGIGGRGFSMPTLPTIPALAVGGRINADGLAYLHKGERVMPADVTYGPRGYAGGPTVVVNVGTTLATKREIAEAVTDALKASGARGLRLA